MDSVKRKAGRAISLAAIAAGFAHAAFAQVAQTVPTQTGPTQPAPAEGVQTFDAAYFRQYNPVTAGDIVSRVPGFEINDGEVLRGFGATAGNVLVNGERPSSKVLISEQLKRIPADSVVKVELISGSASNVDVRGQTQLVNVVLKRANAGGGSKGNWVAEVRDVQYSERVSWVAQLTKTFALGDNAELTLDLQSPNLRGRGDSFEAVRNASGVLTGYREVFGQPNNIGLQGSAVLKWRPTARDTVSFNAQVAPTWNTMNIGSIARNPAGSFTQGTFGLTEYNDNYTAEVGGDWEHRFSPQLSAKVIGLVTETSVDQDDAFRTFTPTGSGPGGLLNTQTINRTTQSGERVARGLLTWRPNGAHTLDVGVEGAFNFRDTTLDIFNNNGSGPAQQFIAVADALVEEERVEPFVTDVWKVSQQLTLETGFIYEASRITQTGDENKEREFSYAKPRVILTWQAGATDQLRASVVRDIAQLEFAQFASSINVVDAFSTLGNPDLEPEKTWKARVEWEKRFGKRGALTIALFHDEVEDVQDFVPRTVCITPGVDVANCAPADLRANDAYGNIGDGTRDGVEVRGAAPLSPLIPNAEIRFSGMWQKTDAEDPVTHEMRRFSNENEWSYNASFRQELPAFKAAWGLSALRLSDRLEFKRSEAIVYDRPSDRVDFFVETTAIEGITLRFTASNMFHPEEFRLRTFYQGDPLNPALAPRATGVILRTEDRKQKGGPEGTQSFAIRASGTF